MTTPTNLAGRPRATDRPTVTPNSHRVGLRAFPRHYSNIRWRMFLASRGGALRASLTGGVPGQRDTPPLDPSWDYRLPAVYRR